MSAESEKLACEWLTKARGDLIVAKLLIETHQIQLDLGVYHCQQSVEKALKGLLTWAELSFPKTHDLTILHRLIVPAFPALQTEENSCQILTPYAIQFRYPGGQEQPSLESAREALNLADRILDKANAVMVRP